jgi:hypothetical protein
MNIDKKILKEIFRYKEINNYLFEQDVPPPPPGGDMGATPPPPPGTDIGAAPPPPPSGTDIGAVPPPPPSGTEGASTTEAKPIDIESDPEVQKIDDENKKEIEVTDLVKSQKSVEEKQEQYFDSLFNHLTDLENKLSAMDNIMDRLNSIETKIEKYRVKTPEEKLELRTLDSGPFNQKLSQFFDEKEDEMEKSGKNEYVLTSDEIESYSPNEIKRSFRDFGDDEMTPENDVLGFKKI